MELCKLGDHKRKHTTPKCKPPIPRDAPSMPMAWQLWTFEPFAGTGAPGMFDSQNTDETERVVNQRAPTWLIGRPPCVACRRQHRMLNLKKMDPDAAKRRNAERLLLFASYAQALHVTMSCVCAEGDVFLHEHHANDVSWIEPPMTELLSMSGVETNVVHPCGIGIATASGEGTMVPARNPTKWESSSHWMHRRRDRRCQRLHTHQSLLSGLAKATNKYPVELIVEIRTRDARHRGRDPARLQRG